MASFPLLASGAAAMYPTTYGPRYNTEVVQFCNDSEQRWVGRAGLADIELVLTNISGYDLSAVVAFFRSSKGSFDSTWQITLVGVTYTSCVFLSDDITWTETQPQFFSLSLKIRQTAGSITAYTTPTNPVYFPQLNSLGMMTQLPYSVTQSYATIGVDMPAGRRWAYSTRGAGLTNFPTGPLTRFNLSYPALSDAERVLLLAFFNAQCGRYGQFTFLDPGGNLVPASENFADPSWTAGGLTVGAFVADPFGGTHAKAITGSGTLTAPVLPGGFASGFRMCASVWVYPHVGGNNVTIELVGFASQAWTLPGNVWTRIECPALLGSNAAVNVRITSSTTMDLFGAQVTPALGPGGYQKSPGNNGLHMKCRFDTDAFTSTQVGPDEHSLQLPIIEYF
jgi:hypothetical protein